MEIATGILIAWGLFLGWETGRLRRLINITRQVCFQRHLENTQDGPQPGHNED